MLLTSYAPPPVRLRAGTRTDSDGDPVEDWATPSRFPLRGAKITPPETEESEAPSPGSLRADRRLVVPGRADLRADDRIEDPDGVVWRVNGDPIVATGLALGVYTRAALVRYKAR